MLWMYDGLNMFLAHLFWIKVVDPSSLTCESVEEYGIIMPLMCVLYCSRLCVCEGFKQGVARALIWILGGLTDGRT